LQGPHEFADGDAIRDLFMRTGLSIDQLAIIWVSCVLREERRGGGGGGGEREREREEEREKKKEKKDKKK